MVSQQAAVSSEQPEISSQSAVSSQQSAVNQPVNTAVAEPVKTAATTTSPVKKTLLKSSPSISSFTRVEEKQEVYTTGATINQISVDFTQEQLEAAWLGYAEVVKAKKRQMDFSILTAHAPVKVADRLVHFTVQNATASERINEDKTDLMIFLRKQLQHFDFQLEIIVSKAEGAAMIYTPADKFSHLAKINPALMKLKQAFDLDTEY